MGGADITLISCRICGAIMMRMSRDVCPKCHAEEEERFHKVKEYLRMHPGASVKEVVQATQVPENHINYFIASGRLERVGVLIEHICQTCNRPITTGLICNDCQRDLKEHVKQLREEVNKPSKRSPDSDGQNKRDEGYHVGKYRKGS